MFTIYLIDIVNTRLLRALAERNIKADIILWLVKLNVFIHLLFLLRGLLCDWQCVDALEYAQLWLAVLIMFAFCYLPVLMYARSIFFQDIVIEGATDDSEVTIPGSGNDNLRFKINEVVYFQADDNYIDVFLTNDLRKVPVRATLKSLEEKLAGYSQFVRIHRSYMINVGFFMSFSKGNNLLTIRYGDLVVELPVSRKYKATVSSLVTSPK